MKVVFIGAYGHYGSAFSADASIDLASYAPSCADETDLTGLSNAGKRYDDWREMVYTEKPDIAVVSPVYCDQAAISIELLRMGINVYCEKPGATTLEQLCELEDAYRSSTAEYRTMLTYYYDPAFKKAADMINNGVIGEPRLISAQKSYKFGTSRPAFYKDHELYGGTIPWVGIHAVTWIHWMSGQRFESVFARGSKKSNRGYGDLDMTCTASFRLTNDVLANINIDYLNAGAAHGDDRVRVACTDGLIEVLHNKVYLNHEEVEYDPQDENIFDAFVNMCSGIPMRYTAEDCFDIARASLIAQKSADLNMEMKVLS